MLPTTGTRRDLNLLKMMHPVRHAKVDAMKELLYKNKSDKDSECRLADRSFVRRESVKFGTFYRVCAVRKDLKSFSLEEDTLAGTSYGPASVACSSEKLFRSLLRSELILNS